ncbi:MAG: MATE family efflux transporter [Desulfotomaculaceae bacterium]|nr:MATE family efflux transporter [Desulfotomaculaceae bacterium]
MIVLLWICMPAILSLIGTSKATIGFARDYLNCVAVSAPLVLMSQAISHIVRAEGKSKEAMIAMLLGTVAIL